MKESTEIPYEIHRATLEDAAFLADQVDRYRQFQGEPTNLSRARRYVDNCLAGNDSVFLICHLGEHRFGYLQMYPGFSALCAERAIIIAGFHLKRYGLGADQLQSLLHEARKQAAEAGYPRLEIPGWGPDDELQHLVETSGGRYWPGSGTYSIGLRKAAQDSRSETADILIPDPNADDVDKHGRKTYTPPGSKFFKRNGALLEGWSIKRRINHLEHIHGSDWWTFYWGHPQGGVITLDMQPEDAYRTVARCHWIFPVLEKKRFYRKEFLLPHLDFRSTDVLQGLDAWLKTTLDATQEGAQPTGNEDVPEEKLWDPIVGVFGAPMLPRLNAP